MNCIVRSWYVGRVWTQNLFILNFAEIAQSSVKAFTHLNIFEIQFDFSFTEQIEIMNNRRGASEIDKKRNIARCGGFHSTKHFILKNGKFSPEKNAYKHNFPCENELLRILCIWMLCGIALKKSCVMWILQLPFFVRCITFNTCLQTHFWQNFFLRFASLFTRWKFEWHSKYVRKNVRLCRFYFFSRTHAKALTFVYVTCFADCLLMTDYLTRKKRQRKTTIKIR